MTDDVSDAKRAARTNGYLAGFGDAVRIFGGDMVVYNIEREAALANYLEQIERRNRQFRDRGLDEPVD